MKEAFTAAAIQMVSSASLQDNLAEAGRLVGLAAERGARFAALPEYFCLMGKRETDKLAIAENPGEGIIQDCLAGLARQHNIWLSSGSIPLVSPDSGRVFNTQLIYDPSGLQIARYDKIHLFSFTRGEENYDEARGIAKYNPLFDWSQDAVWSYLQHRNVPMHPLHRQGYPSIGCEPCTRAIRSDEDVRAGRWWWLRQESKECGLHINAAQ